MTNTKKPEILVVTVTGPKPDTAVVVNNCGNYRMILSQADHGFPSLEPINEATENLCDVLDTSYRNVDIEQSTADWNWIDVMMNWSQEGKPEAKR